MGSSVPPPQPPRKPMDKNIVWAVVLVIGFIVASGIFMVWFGLRILSHGVHVKVAENGPGRKVVSVKTPVGDFRITKDQDVSVLELGLPVYPGATRTKDSDDDSSVSLTFGLPDQSNLRIAVAKFITPDPVSKVREFYQQHLTGGVSSFTQTDRHGKIVFEMEHGDQHKVVSLKSHDGGTQIDLVRIFHGQAEPN